MTASSTVHIYTDHYHDSTQVPAASEAHGPSVVAAGSAVRRRHYIFTPGTVRILLVLAIVCYVMIFAQRYNLPDKLQKDSVKLMEMARGELDTKGSFGATAAILSGIPESFLDAFVFLVGVSTITGFMSRLRSVVGGVMLAFILIPMVVFCLLFPLKDNFVVLMTLAIALLSSRVQSRGPLLLAIVSIYTIYGYYIRIYYLIIVSLFVLLLGLLQLSRTGRIAVIGCILGVFVLLPSNFFRALQEPRDIRMGAANRSNEDLHRTAFGNFAPPDNAKNFICNYVYAAAVLNIPVIAFPTAKSLVLMTTIAMVLLLCVAGIKSPHRTVNAVTLLFVSHPLVLMLFDGDLGSYYRHLVSACALLIPAFTSVENERANATVLQPIS